MLHPVFLAALVPEVRIGVGRGGFIHNNNAKVALAKDGDVPFIENIPNGNKADIF